MSDPTHVHHQVAQEWLRPHRQPSQVRQPAGGVGAVLAILGEMCALPGHAFWVDELSLRDILAPYGVYTHAQVTDLYLLGLAVHKGGKLATLDRRLPAGAIRGGPAAFELIAF